MGLCFFLVVQYFCQQERVKSKNFKSPLISLSNFDLNREYNEILGPLRDIYIQRFLEEYIWRLDVNLEPRIIKLPDTDIEVTEFEFKNHKRLDNKDTKAKNFFEIETFLNRMLEGIGKELSSNGYQLKKSFEAGKCFLILGRK